jgi:hypothetical protein
MISIKSCPYKPYKQGSFEDISCHYFLNPPRYTGMCICEEFKLWSLICPFNGLPIKESYPAHIGDYCVIETHQFFRMGEDNE